MKPNKKMKLFEQKNTDKKMQCLECGRSFTVHLTGCTRNLCGSCLFQSIREYYNIEGPDQLQHEGPWTS
jgi:NMD protein affecting ribosome stability and mRNA decay